LHAISIDYASLERVSQQDRRGKWRTSGGQVCKKDERQLERKTTLAFTCSQGRDQQQQQFFTVQMLCFFFYLLYLFILLVVVGVCI